jgi:hypothetical protein
MSTSAFPVPTVKRVVTGNGRTAGGHCDDLGFASAKSFSTLLPRRLRLEKAKGDPLSSPIVPPLLDGKSMILFNYFSC